MQNFMQLRDNRVRAEASQNGPAASGGEPTTSPMTSILGYIGTAGDAFALGSLVDPRAPDQSASAVNAARWDIKHNAGKMRRKDNCFHDFYVYLAVPFLAYLAGSRT